jgi:hypothetical protein
MYLTGMLGSFSGENAKYFYSFVQKKLIDWCIFYLSWTIIGTLDLYYFRKSNLIEEDELTKSFLKNSYQKVMSKSKRKKIF